MSSLSLVKAFPGSIEWAGESRVINTEKFKDRDGQNVKCLLRPSCGACRPWGTRWGYLPMEEDGGEVERSIVELC